MVCWDCATTVINEILLSKFSWSTHWFKITAQIPSDWSDQEVHFRWNSNSEVMVRLPEFSDQCKLVMIIVMSLVGAQRF